MAELAQLISTHTYENWDFSELELYGPTINRSADARGLLHEPCHPTSSMISSTDWAPPGSHGRIEWPPMPERVVSLSGTEDRRRRSCRGDTGIPRAWCRMTESGACWRSWARRACRGGCGLRPEAYSSYGQSVCLGSVSDRTQVE